MDLCKRDLETLRFRFVLLVHRVCLQTKRCDNLILQPLFLLDRGLFVTVLESFLEAEIEAQRGESVGPVATGAPMDSILSKSCGCRATLQLIGRAAVPGTERIKHFSLVWTVCANQNMEVYRKEKRE